LSKCTPKTVKEFIMTASPMTPDRFWQIIEIASRSGNDPDAQLSALGSSLQKLTIEEIISFEVAFRQFLNNAYTWDLWGAAFVIHGGCSDDGFEYFRRWLVSKGRSVYEAALINPDSLAALQTHPGPDGVWEFEEFYYVAGGVFEEKGGDGDVREHSADEAGLGGPGPTGEQFGDDEESLSKLYPKLWKRFGAEPLG
jgi:Protein of unknown function (DUF4240)